MTTSLHKLATAQAAATCECGRPLLVYRGTLTTFAGCTEELHVCAYVREVGVRRYGRWEGDTDLDFGARWDFHYRMGQ